ncbi:RNA polymerase II transcription elongation factor-domain-containing protein [Talaromyces proteolyticus]|uniref:RNA polymerase II transcription elongation factor-domain-containing protein n=1 Tax=Talaromyces proteolyticus TaxID=1131652 RepID=A0AAD4KLC3_9EURO|nr:RNA polymerase II transcription elongation factor-domain-containing protein [Talaromyces proteolyticus]KAH8695373.1 RNA polymerase II transcription elongation factor-domain-containing protein [Talaromyces proteolyticus]
MSLGSGTLIDPSKPGEYPILLGDKLARKGSVGGSSFVNITYNHKSKSATPNQRTKITRSSVSQDIYNLTITDKAGNAEQTTLEYKYKGSVDPSLPVQNLETRNLVLVFDANRKAFILEPVGTNLNFNLRSAPGKNKEAIDQIEQLHTLDDDADHASRDETDDESQESADRDNPYDFRHFLPKPNVESSKPTLSTTTTPDPHGAVSRIDTPVTRPTKVEKTNPKTLPKARQQTNLLHKPKQGLKSAPMSTAPATSATKKRPPKSAERVESEDLSSESAPSDDEQAEPQLDSNKSTASPSSNIIIDGDLIIDMGSPPSRPSFKVNPAHFSSNNSSANEADDDDEEEEDIEDLRLPSPARQDTTAPSTDAKGEDEDDEDALAAEMEAAFEEEASRTQNMQQTQRYISEDESEVSEEE